MSRRAYATLCTDTRSSLPHRDIDEYTGEERDTRGSVAGKEDLINARDSSSLHRNVLAEKEHTEDRDSDPVRSTDGKHKAVYNEER